MSNFRSDHHVRELAGRSRLTKSRVRDALLSRSLWLQERIEQRRERGEPVDWFVTELKAIEQAAELFESKEQAMGSR